MGSVTKQFTAASILLLQERGKLKTDDPGRDVRAGVLSPNPVFRSLKRCPG